MKPVLFIALLAISHAAMAADLKPGAAGEVLDRIARGFDTYLDPAIGRRAQAALQANRDRLVVIDDREAFARAVTDLMRAETNDLHVTLRVVTADAGAGAAITPEQRALLDKRAANGLLAIRRLPANIGYLKLRHFEQSEAGAALMDGAMAMLKDTDALIIDLRENTGGGGLADEALLGHLSDRPIPMVSIRWRQADGTETVQQRQVRVPPGGPLYADKPVFLLTAKRTFSAAEEFAYNLKQAGRATLIGETTRGGANPANRPVPLGYGFRVFIPNGHVTHPATGTNWEGVGIAPDVVTPVEQALTEAFVRAVKAARPLVSTPQTEAERARAIAEPAAVLLADQPL